MSTSLFPVQAPAKVGFEAPGRWRLPQHDPTLDAHLARDTGLHPVLASLLAARGVRTPDEAERFLRPSLEDLHAPSSMLGMGHAVARTLAAIRTGEPILIYGDYDVDGTTAVVLLKTAIELLGGTAGYHVPHRLREGYGMQREVLERASGEGVRLVISVDTGIRAFAAAEAAAALGLDLIVTDHHLPEDGSLPTALAILNPLQPDCGYASKALCGAGIAFKLAQALLEADAEAAEEAVERQRRRDRVRTRLVPSFLKMLAIATVADAVPLTGENRAIVALGLQALRQPASPGLRALLSVSSLDPAQRPLTAGDIGFRLGPRINAAGRMDVASEVVELFTTRDPNRAAELAARLDALNTGRRAAEADVMLELDARLAEPEIARAPLLVLDGEGWHRGVIGILASRVVDRTGRPALVVAHEDGEAYGSGRSVEGFHLLAALEHCAGLFTRFGGHAHAVGFSLPSARVGELRAALQAYAREQLGAEPARPAVACDVELALDRITPALFRELARLEPFGVGNPEPVFLARAVVLAVEPRFIKDKHVKLEFTEGTSRWSAMGWRWAERLRMLAPAPGTCFDLAYKLRENEHPEYGGLELEMVDLQPCEQA